MPILADEHTLMYLGDCDDARPTTEDPAGRLYRFVDDMHVGRTSINGTNIARASTCKSYDVQKWCK